MSASSRLERLPAAAVCLLVLVFAAAMVPAMDARAANPDSSTHLKEAAGALTGTWEIRGAFGAAGVKTAQTASGTKPAAIDNPVVPAHPIRTGLILLHLFGVVAGMGSALLLDAHLFRKLYDQSLTSESMQLIELGGKLVQAGLAALWISGLGFLVFYWNTVPELLMNPKIWAKLLVVCFLTLNGWVIHKWVIPKLRSAIGRPALRNAGPREVVIFILPAAISTVGWFFPFVLGVVKEMNRGFSAAEFLVVYVALVCTFVLAAGAFHLARSGHPFFGDAPTLSRNSLQHG